MTMQFREAVLPSMKIVKYSDVPYTILSRSVKLKKLDRCAVVHDERVHYAAVNHGGDVATDAPPTRRKSRPRLR